MKSLFADRGSRLNCHPKWCEILHSDDSQLLYATICSRNKIPSKKETINIENFKNALCLLLCTRIDTETSLNERYRMLITVDKRPPYHRLGEVINSALSCIRYSKAIAKIMNDKRISRLPFECYEMCLFSLGNQSQPDI